MFKKNLGYLAPSVVRAATFYLDRQWGLVVETLAAVFLPYGINKGTGFARILLQTVLLTLSLTFFEQWMNGELQFWNFSVFGSEHKGAGDPAIGVTQQAAEDAFLF